MRTAARPATAGKIVVRTGKGYAVDFNVDLGQHNAVIRRGVLTPLRRVVSWGEAVTALPERSIDLIHSINAVPLTTRPHVITFEDYLPRTPPDTNVGVAQRVIRALLQRRQCVRLLAISEYALRQFRWQNRDYEGLPELERKIELCFPSISVREPGPKPLGDTLRLLFVGRDFMRKGLPAVLQAHRSLAQSGIPVETHVVSALDWDQSDYIGPTDERIVRAARDDLAQDGVVHHGMLPNTRALELMRDATFLVLPTLHDTFGYVALEAMAAGTPVIATRTCALPEIVRHGQTGYLLALENDANVGKWIWTYRRDRPDYDDAYSETVDRLGADLAGELRRFWENSRHEYETMSASALETVRTRFDIGRTRDRLDDLYNECMQIARRPSRRRRPAQ